MRKRTRRISRLLAGLQRQAVVVDHDHHAVALDDRPLLGEVQRDDRNVFEVDVLPDVELGPVGERKDADAFALVDLGVVEVPQLGPLVLGIPAVELIAEGEDALLGPRLFFVAAGAAEGGVELYLLSACFRPSVFMTSVWTLLPCVIGLMPASRLLR